MSSESEIDLPVKEGDVIAGKYRVDRVLGVGGMGAVVAAEHTDLEQRVAIKFMLEAAAKNEVGKKRFLREAQAATKLRSEHVTRMLDFGTLDDGVPYLVMELLEGKDLDVMIRAAGKLPIEEACEIVLQTCEALAEAHGRGIVHRDIKPANLFVTRRADGSPAVKVLDFGIAKHRNVAEIEGTALTRSNALLGSPMYMSLEQFRAAREVDARSDIWSLGVVLYKALTGAMPFVADSLGSLIMVLMTEDPEPLERHREDLPEALSAVVLRCLQKDPAERYQSVAELAEGLAPFAPERSRPLLDRIRAHLATAREGASLPPPEGSGERTGNNSPGQTTGSGRGSKKEIASGERASAPPMGKTAATWSQTEPGAPSRSGKWFVLTGVVALLVGIVGTRLWPGRGEQNTPTVEPPPPPAVEAAAPMPSMIVAPVPIVTVAPVASAEATAAPPSGSATTSATAAAPKGAAPMKTATTKPAPTEAASATPAPTLVPDFGGRK